MKGEGTVISREGDHYQIRLESSHLQSQNRFEPFQSTSKTPFEVGSKVSIEFSLPYTIKPSFFVLWMPVLCAFVTYLFCARLSVALFVFAFCASLYAALGYRSRMRQPIIQAL
ncbi:MAG: hypothetical protein Q8Q33_01860 [Chlamydiota bacterium]|nr:hypothetical protein [Chlamydiota bacterium]